MKFLKNLENQETTLSHLNSTLLLSFNSEGKSIVGKKQGDCFPFYFNGSAMESSVDDDDYYGGTQLGQIAKTRQK
jgi:hypothetical protein